MQKTSIALVKILSLQPDCAAEILRLAKLAYLSDYLFAKTFGEGNPFSGIYKRFSFGPVPDKFYAAIEELKSEGVIRKTNNIIRLVDKQDTSSLTEEEVACIEKVAEDFKGKSLNALLKVAYATEPMLRISEREAALGVKLQYEEVDFHQVAPHPLLNKMDEVDTDFLKSREYQESIK
jgi:uncharacterized phage-associated protein